MSKLQAWRWCARNWALPASLGTATSLCNLARLLRSQHKSAEAETLLREALATQRKLLGNDNPDVALWLEQLAGSLGDQGRLSEAEAPLRGCLSIREKRLPDDWLTSGARSALGENLMARKQYAEAEPLLISGYNGLCEREAKIPAANKPRLEKAAERIIRLYENNGAARQGRRMQAEAWGAGHAHPGKVRRSGEAKEITGKNPCHLILAFPLLRSPLDALHPELPRFLPRPSRRGEGRGEGLARISCVLHSACIQIEREILFSDEDDVPDDSQLPPAGPGCLEEPGKV